MGIPVEEVMKKLPPERQKRIRAQADKYIQEYETLQELRKQLDLTQTDVAENMGVKQVSISNLEKRSDMLISTLKSYVEAMGCELEMFIKTPEKKQVKIGDLTH